MQDPVLILGPPKRLGPYLRIKLQDAFLKKSAYKEASLHIPNHFWRHETKMT